MMRKNNSGNGYMYLLLIGLIVLGVIEGLVIIHHTNGKPKQEAVIGSHAPHAIATKSGFDSSQYSVNKADSPWVIVNKGRVLPGFYVPAKLTLPNVPLRLGSASAEMHLRVDATGALNELVKAAASSGLYFRLASGYRSYANQAATYGGFVKTDGTARADNYSARPGHSEHQTGLAADLESYSRKCELQDCFGELPEGKWLAANCYKFGFIIRYQQNAQNLTGYQYEPWHVRYVGKDLAGQIHKTGQTLEQFFGLPAYAAYPATMYSLK